MMAALYSLGSPETLRQTSSPPFVPAARRVASCRQGQIRVPRTVAHPTLSAARFHWYRATATFREELVLLVFERAIVEDVVKRLTTRLFLDEVRDAQLSMVAASVSCIARPPYSK